MKNAGIFLGLTWCSGSDMHEILWYQLVCVAQALARSVALVAPLLAKTVVDTHHDSTFANQVHIHRV